MLGVRGRYTVQDTILFQAVPKILHIYFKTKMFLKIYIICHDYSFPNMLNSGNQKNTLKQVDLLTTFSVLSFPVVSQGKANYVLCFPVLSQGKDNYVLCFLVVSQGKAKYILCFTVLSQGKKISPILSCLVSVYAVTTHILSC